MPQSKYLIFFFTVLCYLYPGQANTLSCGSDISAVSGVDKYNPPAEKKKKRKRKRKKRKFNKKSSREPSHQNAQKDLADPALTFWFIFALSSIFLAIMGAFIIGLGMAPWSLALYVLLGAEVAAFTVIISVIWLDKPGDPAIVQFVFALLALVAISAIMGLGFIIWGFIIAWPFGWMIGLILLGLAAIFLAVHLILANISA